MALTRDFKSTVQARAKRDPAFRRALLQEALEAMLAGDLRAGTAVLRDYINFTTAARHSAAPPVRHPRD